MADMNIDMAIVDNAINQQGGMAIDAFTEAARDTIRSGGRVIVKDPLVSTMQVIASVSDLDKWRKKITPVPLKRFTCPHCGKPLKYIGSGAPDRFKCYDPPGCGSIYRLADRGSHLMRLDERSAEEIQYPAEEL